MWKNNIFINSKNQYWRAWAYRFVEKYQIVLYLFLIPFWTLGIFVIFTLGAEQLKHWNDNQFYIWQCSIFIPLFIIGFFWIIFLLILFIKPKFLNHKIAQIVLFILYGISILFFYAVNGYLLAIGLMTKQYILIWEFCSFLISFTLVYIVFFFQTSLYRFKKVKFNLKEYPNFNFEIINQKLD